MKATCIPLALVLFAGSAMANDIERAQSATPTELVAQSMPVLSVTLPYGKWLILAELDLSIQQGQTVVAYLQANGVVLPNYLKFSAPAPTSGVGQYVIMPAGRSWIYQGSGTVLLMAVRSPGSNRAWSQESVLTALRLE